MKRFDFLTIAGVVFGLGLVLWGILMESELSAFINLPGIMITLGGSFGAMLINFEMGQVRQVMKITMQVLFDKEQNVISQTAFCKAGAKSSQGGAVALEDDLDEIKDPFCNGLRW